MKTATLSHSVVFAMAVMGASALGYGCTDESRARQDEADAQDALQSDLSELDTAPDVPIDPGPIACTPLTINTCGELRHCVDRSPLCRRGGAICELLPTTCDDANPALGACGCNPIRYESLCSARLGGIQDFFFVCVPSGATSCDLYAESACGDGEICVAEECDVPPCTGSCVARASACDTPQLVCETESETGTYVHYADAECWNSVCEAYDQGYRGRLAYGYDEQVVPD